MTSTQMLLMYPPVVVTMWLLLRLLSFAFAMRMVKTKNPACVLAVGAAHRLRELYEIGVVVCIAAKAAAYF